MKSSAHLFYGIIIGILLCACTGSLKQDKAEFKEEKILGGGFLSQGNSQKNIEIFKEQGWTIIDWEINKDGTHYFHVGK